MTPSLNHVQITDAKPKRPGWRRSGEVPSPVFSVTWSTALIDASFSVAVGWKSPRQQHGWSCGWAQRQGCSAVNPCWHLHPAVPPAVPPAPGNQETFCSLFLGDYPSLRPPAITACSGNSVRSSDSLSCPNLSGWGRVKRRGWPPHMSGAFQCLTPELLRCVCLNGAD